MIYTLKSDIPISIQQVANIHIYMGIYKNGIAAPLPPSYTTPDGRTLDNTFHPAYHDMLQAYELQKNDVGFTMLLEKGVTIDKCYMQSPKWKKIYKANRKNPLLGWDNQSEAVVFLKNFALTDDNEKQELTKLICLTETDVFQVFNAIQIKRDGFDILKANIRNAVNTGITIDELVINGHQLVNPLDEKAACASSNMDWQKWMDCTYSIEEKAIAVGLWRLESVKETHQNDAVQIESERKSKKS